MKDLKDFKNEHQLKIDDLPWIARQERDSDDWEVNVTHPIFHHMTVMDGTTAELANLMAAAPDMYLEGKIMLEKFLCKNCVGHTCGNCKTCDYGKFRAAVEKAQDFEVEEEEEKGDDK